MPPSASRKARARKPTEPQERFDAEDQPSATPSRKRRRVNNYDGHNSPNATDVPDGQLNSAARRKKKRNSDIQVFEDDPSFGDEPDDHVNASIRALRIASYDIQARIDYANEKQQAEHPEGKQAYAKIAGNGWTFYVEDLEVRIGRPPDERSHAPQGASGLADTSLVHIDLGPSKLVSRQHAEIRYDEQTAQWNIHVIGRNGARLDERPLRRGDTAVVSSGTVIDIADTQMMFVTPNAVPVIAPSIQEQVRAHSEDNEEEDDDIDLMPPPHSQRTPTRAQGRPGQSNRPPSSSNAHSSTRRQPHKQAELGSHGSAALNDGPLDARFPSSHTKARPSSGHGSQAMLLDASDDVDYSQDSARDLKPPHSYAQMIGMAILSSPEEKLTLAKIYDWIKERYAYYRLNGGGWQNSIRHNLSLNKCFEKIARRTDEPGKGMKWQIVAEHRDDFIKKGLNQRRGLGRGSSGPSSPMKDALLSTDADARHEGSFLKSVKDADYGRQPTDNPFVKNSPGSTPPMAKYPVAKNAFTPDRPGNIFGRLQGPDASSPRNGYGGVSPFPLSSRSRHNGLTDAAAAGSPGGPTMLMGSDPNDSLVTPLISRFAPKLAPPSAAALPSQFMPMSSPAPFWKYADFGSTPAKPQGLALDMSPVKSEKAKIEKDSDDDVKMPAAMDSKNVKLSGIRSSSPTLPEAGRESPTKPTVNRPTERGGSAVSSQSRSFSEAKDSKLAPWSALQKKEDTPKMATPISPAVGEDDDEEDEEEEGGIDLTRGFQHIGHFHLRLKGS